MNQPHLDAAAAELRGAADLADARADRDPFSPWAALAGQLRLVAAGLDPAPATVATTRLTPASHTAAALVQLDRLHEPSEPEDVDFWRRQVEDLHERAVDLGARWHGNQGPS